MAAGILEHDLGYVFGTTWHGLPQYEQLKRPVMYDEAVKVMDYPLEKVQLYREVKTRTGRRFLDVNAWSIIRSDHDEVLVDHVGEQFTCVSNLELLEFINKHLLQKYDELSIESVGTLWNGATAFVNIKLDEFCVKGDKSQTVTNLMYHNPLGRGAYKAGAHSTRIVCNNTLTVAEMQAAANKTLLKAAHTINAAQKISDHLIELADLKLGLKEYREKLAHLAAQAVNTKYLNEFMELFIPIDEKEDSQSAQTRKQNKRDMIITEFNNKQEMTKSVAESRYGLLQAVTFVVDHEEPSRGNDEASLRWDAISGRRANIKRRAFDLLAA